MRISLFSLWLVFAVPVFGAELKIDFGGFPAWSFPTNFHSALAGGGRPGEWKIVMDEVPAELAPLTPQGLAVNHKAVLAQTSTDPADERFPLCIYDGETFKNFKLTTRFKIVGGTNEQMAGLVFRYQNASNFYVIRASALGHNVRFYKMVDGLRTDPIGPQLDVTTNTWHTLGLQCQGNEITFWFDNKAVMPTLQDSTFADGKIGYWTKSDAVSYFGDTTIDYTPRIPAAQALVNSTLRQEPRILGLQLFTLDASGQPHILASTNQTEIGQPGAEPEKSAITDGKIYYGREKGTDVIILPLRDRNGEPIAAVRLRLKSFLGEMQDTALSRANMILKVMEKQVTTAAELMK